MGISYKIAMKMEDGRAVIPSVEIYKKLGYIFNCPDSKSVFFSTKYPPLGILIGQEKPILSLHEKDRKIQLEQVGE